MNEWIDGVLSSVSRFFFLPVSLLVCTFAFTSRCSETHALTHIYAKRSKKQETKEQNKKNRTHSWRMNRDNDMSQPTDADRSKNVQPYIIKRIIEKKGRKEEGLRKDMTNQCYIRHHYQLFNCI